MDSLAERTSSQAELAQALEVLAGNRRRFARLPVARKAELLEAMLPSVAAVAPEWAEAACRAKGIPQRATFAGEEWLAGIMPTLRGMRLLARGLRQVAASGRPALGRSARLDRDGRPRVEAFPAGGWDGLLYAGIHCSVRFLPELDLEGVRRRQASFYRERDPEGHVSLVLGAGNVSSIPVLDSLYKMFVEGGVALLKLNPVNAWLGPFFERGLAPLFNEGFLRLAYGGAEVGAALCEDARVDRIHVTGSERTHDAIVWGQSPEEQARRKREGNPRLKKPITSELGNVSPVAIVPGRYLESELAFQARHLVTMVVNNASFNCNAAKLLVTARGWPQRDRFLELVSAAFERAAPRVAYYPGAEQRYRDLLAGRSGVRRFGAAAPGVLPWALVSGLDPEQKDETLFRVEPFCGILSHVEISEARPASFLSDVTEFCNERLWGTLNAALIIDPRSEADPDVEAALERAVSGLRYGTVAINLWPAAGYASVSPPWGGHPSATLDNIQSGLGWVHNTFMLEGIEKSVLRASIVQRPNPPWFFDSAQQLAIGERITRFEARPSLWRVPGMISRALLG